MTSSRISRLVRVIAGVSLACLCSSSSALALVPGDLALICNRQVPASVDLAKYYAKQRGIPETRIIELDLPDGEVLPASQMDPDVILPIRKALNDRGIRPFVKCLVTFYGVPLKVAPRTATPAEQKETAELTAQRDQVSTQVVSAVINLELAVQAADPAFKPAAAVDMEQLTRRANAAIARANQLVQSARDEQARKQLLTPLLDAVVKLAGPVGLLRNAQPPMLDYVTALPTTLPAGTNLDRWNALAQEANQANEEAGRMAARRYEPQARARLRELTSQYLGLLETYRLLSAQIDYLAPEVLKSLDSELPLLWVNSYSRKDGLPNPLKWNDPRREQSPTLMVMRLDGPQSGTARDIIMASLATERRGGLEGVLAIDSRGIPPRDKDGKPDGYGRYDQRLRDLTALVQKHGRMSILHDDTDTVFKPNAAQNIALYCGWYSVRKYVPSFQFVPGAVGFHIASFEMISLRTETETGWCRGLLNDGIAATIGSVDEPYLGSFPDPVEFYSLLLTGKYTLGEVYWLTTPTINWKMVMIGDPLYNPYGPKPALKPEDVPHPLRSFVAPAPSPPPSSEHLPGHF